MLTEKSKFHQSVWMTLVHNFDKVAKAMAKADAENAGLKGFAKFFYVRRRTKEWLSLKQDFKYATLTLNIAAICKNQEIPNPVEVLVNLSELKLQPLR